MPPRQQLAETRPAPPGQLLWRLCYFDWDTTPGRLRVVLIVLVLGVLLTGGVGVYASITRVNTTRDIAEHLEPLRADVTELYRSLADADATVAAGYLSGGVEPSAIQTHYREDIVAATRSLARAGAQAGGEQPTAQLIADITTKLPEYTGLVESARSNHRQGFPVGASYLRRASDLMQKTILKEAAELQQQQAALLDDAYRRAGSVPVVALVACLVSLAGLGWAQVFLFRRTHRVFNVGLVLASVAMLTGLVWWIVVVVVSATSLAGARGHSQSVSDALAPAQVAALQARGLESHELIYPNGAAIEPDFQDRMQQLARNNGAGDALSAAKQFATDQKGTMLVQAAVDDSVGYAGAHQQVRKLDDAGDYSKAVDAAVRTTAPTAFHRLAETLSTAVEYESGAVGKDIERARGWLTDRLSISTGALALASAVGVALGIRQRLEEYR